MNNAFYEKTIENVYNRQEKTRWKLKLDKFKYIVFVISVKAKIFM